MGINIARIRRGRESRLPSSASLHSTYVSQERMPRTALPPETRKTHARPHRRHSASSVGAAKRAPRAMCAQRPAQETTHKYGGKLDGATNSGRVNVEVMTGKRKRFVRAHVPSSSVTARTRTVDFIEAEDDVVEVAEETYSRWQ